MQNHRLPVANVLTVGCKDTVAFLPLFCLVSFVSVHWVSVQPLLVLLLHVKPFQTKKINNVNNYVCKKGTIFDTWLVTWRFYRLAVESTLGNGVCHLLNYTPHVYTMCSSMSKIKPTLFVVIRSQLYTVTPTYGFVASHYTNDWKCIALSLRLGYYATDARNTPLWLHCSVRKTIQWAFRIDVPVPVFDE